MAAGIEVFETPEALGRALAADVLEVIRIEGANGRPILLGCPGGRSLRITYREIGRQAAETGADLSRLVIVMMDEYLVRENGRLVACDPAAHYSCRRFGEEQIRAPFNAHLPAARQAAAENVWLPDAADPGEYDRRIEGAGGIALFLLASGASDGHVAFNPPGTARDTKTAIIPLARTTRRDNLKTFPEFGSLDEVPTHGVSSGISTIADLSRRAVLVLTGSEKRQAAERIRAARSYDPAWPSTVIHDCANARVLVDRAAAGATGAW